MTHRSADRSSPFRKEVRLTQAEQLAEFVTRASDEDLSEAARGQLKIRPQEGFRGK